MRTCKLTVDGKVVEVPLGATILDAANAAGSRVPILCHDNKLHPFGACRICLVEVEGTPRKFTPSCTTPVSDNMVIRTMSPDLFDIRRTVLELLLINHPLDCPVCDKAGSCALQDLVHEYGLAKPRFDAEKGYLPSDYQSAIIERHISRCILCGKCVRICEEQNAVSEWVFTRRGTKARISTDFDRPLNCEFCGECVEICPVGALTTKQFTYRGRTWNMEPTASVCTYCGNGCRITYQTRLGRIVRVKSGAKNYLCGKGRFGWDAVHHPDRLTTPLVRIGGELVPATWDDALAMVVTNLNVIRNKRGADSIGGLGSVRTTNEENYLFQKVLRGVVGTNNVDLLARLKTPRGLNTAFFSGEVSRIGEHDAVLVLDKDVGEINPLTGIEIVRAVNRSLRKLILVNDGVNKFNRLASVVLNHPSAGSALADLLPALTGGGSPAARQAAAILKEAKSVAVIIPARLSDKEYAQIGQLLAQLKGVTTYPLVRRSNVQGAMDMGVIAGYYPGYRKIAPDATSRLAAIWNTALPDGPGLNAVEMLAGITSGAVAALYVMGDDPAGSDDKLKKVLEKLEFLVVQDIFLTETAKLAHVVLPACSIAEKTGTVTSLERRLQEVRRAEEPHGDAKPDWEILQAVARKMGSPLQYASADDIRREIRATVPLYADLPAGSCWPRELSPLAGSAEDLSLHSDSVMRGEVLTADRLLFSSGTMSTRSKELGTVCIDTNVKV
jgi:predicted molibdopterin-dependent oxidoreductase YjgC